MPTRYISINLYEDEESSIQKQMFKDGSWLLNFMNKGRNKDGDIYYETVASLPSHIYDKIKDELR